MDEVIPRWIIIDNVNNNIDPFTTPECGWRFELADYTTVQGNISSSKSWRNPRYL